jgi:hypothetical protein
MDPLRIGRYGILGASVGVRGTEKALSGDSAVMNELDVASRICTYETAQFLVRRLPGFDRAHWHIMATCFHSRGGRSIVSEHRVTVDAARGGAPFDDVVFLMGQAAGAGAALAAKAGITPRELEVRELQTLLCLE